MLARNSISEVKRLRQRANQKRYRRRQVYGQMVPRITINAEYVINLLVAKRYLPDNVVHDREMIARALSKYIDDEAKKE